MTDDIRKVPQPCPYCGRVHPPLHISLTGTCARRGGDDLHRASCDDIRKAPLELRILDWCAQNRATNKDADQVTIWIDGDYLFSVSLGDLRRASDAYGALASSETVREATRYRHRKRGSTYVKVGNAHLQTSTPLEDMAVLIVYKSEADGTMWVRAATEFFDGRFEELPTMAPDQVVDVNKAIPVPSGYAGLVQRAKSWDRCYPGNINIERLIDDMTAAITALVGAVEREREECAKVAEDHARAAERDDLYGHDRIYEARRIATAIRARAALTDKEQK